MYIFRYAGTAATLASLAFVGLMFYSKRNVWLQFDLTWERILAVGGSSISYALCGLLLARAWHQIISWAEGKAPDPRLSRRIYARSQIWKYIPGNVAQLAGRHTQGRAVGWSHVGLATSSIVELCLLIFVSVAILAPTYAFISLRNKTSSVQYIALAGVLFAATAFIVFSQFRKAAGRSSPEMAYRLRIFNLFALWKPAILYLCFFLATGFILAVLVHAVTPSTFQVARLPIYMGAFILSWLLWVITPGAPGGIGVREATIILALDDLMPSADALIVAGWMRIVTITGDLLFFCAAWVVPNYFRPLDGPPTNPLEPNNS